MAVKQNNQKLSERGGENARPKLGAERPDAHKKALVAQQLFHCIRLSLAVGHANDQP